MSVSEERARSGSDSRTQLASKTWGRFDKEREETLGSHTAAYEYEEVFFFFFFLSRATRRSRVDEEGREC